MKIIKQTVLVFVEGKTAKVYEIDLCEVGSGQYVVNFRYGKRGSVLKDGSKTPLSVGHSEAETVFAKLAQTKIEQGYVPAAQIAEARARTEAMRSTASSLTSVSSSAK